VPDTTVATNLDKTFDIKTDRFSQLTLNFVLAVNEFPDAVNLLFAKVINFSSGINARLSQNLPTHARPDAVNVL